MRTGVAGTGRGRWACTVAWWLLAAVAGAQSDRGTISGTVADATQAMVPGARVVAVNSATGARHETLTNGTGNYILPSLPAGTYELTVEMAGMKRFAAETVRVQVAQSTRVDAVLEVGAASETVTIVADAPLLKVGSAEQSTTISRELLSSLPFNFAATGTVRNALSVVALAPGASISPNSVNNIKVNGLPVRSYKITVDGQDVTSANLQDRWDGTMVSVEAMEEFTVQTSNFAAEYGQVGGGLFNFTSRSGTNRLHGSAYSYFAHEGLNAAQPYQADPADPSKHFKGEYRKYDFGFSLGGPVVLPGVYDGRNKTFFFVNMERFKADSTAVVLQTVPTSRMRAGDFGEILTGRVLGTDPLGRPIYENAIYDPLTTRTVLGADGRTYVVRDPFPNNVVPSSRFDPVAARIQGLIPAPTKDGIVNNFDPVESYPQRPKVYGFKLDHSLNPRSRLSLYFSRMTSNKLNSIDGLPEPLTARRTPTAYSNTFRVSLDQTLSSSLLLHAGFGYLRYRDPDTAPPGVIEFDAASELGLRGAYGSGFPRLGGLNSAFGGVVNIINGFGPTQRNLYDNDKMTAVASATWLRGGHTLKAGAQFAQDYWVIDNSTDVAGAYGFGAADTALPYLGTTNLGGQSIGFPYASFLLGLANNGQIKNGLQLDYRRPEISLYAQDTWRISNKLTVDYGLRWDYAWPVRDKEYRTAAFDPNIPNPSAGGRLGATAYEGYGPGRCNCVFSPSYAFAFGPRVGASYQLGEKTVVRAGWGISYTQTPVFSYLGSNTTPIGVGFNTLTFGAPTFGTPAGLLANGWQYDPAALTVASLDPGIRPSPGQINTPPPRQDPNGGRPGRINQWNLSFQRELFKGMVVEAAYVGNRGVWLTSGDASNIGLNDLNALTPERVRAVGLDLGNPDDRSLLTSTFTSGRPQARGFQLPYAGFPAGQTLAQSLRPYPQFGTLFTLWSPLGNTWYDSLQAKLTARVWHGLDLSAAFTWQKELVRGTEDTRGRGFSGNDVLNRDKQKGLSPSSVPLAFVVGFNYETPAAGSSRLARGLTGGWMVSGIFRYASGALIRIPSSQNNLGNLLFRGTYVNRVPGQPLFLKDPNCGCIDPNKDAVLNPAAWQDAPPGQFGSTAVFQNDYRWMRRPEEQLGLGKRIRMKDDVNLLLRFEFFNVFNHVYLNPPSSGNANTPQTQALSGFGRLNPNNVGDPRRGQVTVRLQW